MLSSSAYRCIIPSIQPAHLNYSRFVFAHFAGNTMNDTSSPDTLFRFRMAGDS